MNTNGHTDATAYLLKRDPDGLDALAARLRAAGVEAGVIEGLLWVQVDDRTHFATRAEALAMLTKRG